MKIIKESPEHHFLTFIDKIKRDPANWAGIHIALSRKMVHDEIIAKPEHISGKLHALRKKADDILQGLTPEMEKFKIATVYFFADGDIVLLACLQNEGDRGAFRDFYKNIAAQHGEKLCHYSNLSKDIYNYQKLADERFLSAQRVKAYEAMADMNRIHSIGLRRERHEDAVVLIVEDDRFTASYASNLLNKDYDVVLAKTGEEAIMSYIEYAPDIVYLDIHLPGLNGHDTLSALRKIDPEAFIVMLSVDTAKENVVLATRLGAAGFLKKPFSKERLLAVTEKSPFVKRTGASSRV